jgi:hypothetical protein
MRRLFQLGLASLVVASTFFVFSSRPAEAHPYRVYYYGAPYPAYSVRYRPARVVYRPVAPRRVYYVAPPVYYGPAYYPAPYYVAPYCW